MPAQERWSGRVTRSGHLSSIMFDGLCPNYASSRGCSRTQHTFEDDSGHHVYGGGAACTDTHRVHPTYFKNVVGVTVSAKGSSVPRGPIGMWLVKDL
ncbi:hypothetical protein Plhal304r1_c004g0017211 [Plasmopara halstedii]